jgi:hypothetical protein
MWQQSEYSAKLWACLELRHQMTQYLDDYSNLEDAVAAFLRTLVRAQAQEISGLKLSAHQYRELVTKLTWRVATALDSGRIFSIADGRPVLSSLD